VELMEATGQSQIVDLCSGGGGGVLAMRRELLAQGTTDATFELSDLYPNAATIERVKKLGDPRVKYRDTPLNALKTPRDLRGIRTMFGALHHFQPEQVEGLLKDAVAAAAPVAFFDAAASEGMRKVPAVFAPLLSIPNLLVLFVVALLVMPFAKPFRVSRLLLTYLIPAIPLLFAWDGNVSALRAYLPEELLAMARGIPGGESYEWQSGRAGLALYLIGKPRG